MEDLLTSLLVAGCLGALIGLERQWDNQFHHPDRSVPAGLRTFTLWAVLGQLCAYFGREAHGWIFPLGFIAVGVWLGVFLGIRDQKKYGSGLTTAAVGLITYLIGALVEYDQIREAVVLTVGILLLLAGKGVLHETSRRFTRDDVRAALKFAAVTGIILPLVPHSPMGPFDAFNPWSIWLMVVIVSGVGFAGYVAMRIFGASLGIALTGLVGGLASSTATTLAMSRLSREKPEISRDCALAVVLACTVMLWRVALIVGMVVPSLLLALWLPIVVMSIPGVAYGIYFWRQNLRQKQKHKKEESVGQIKNPLNLRTAIVFALLYALIVFGVKASQHYFGDAGLYVVSFFSGLTDLDAISLSLSQMVSGGMKPDLAATGIVIAAIANTFLKGGFALVLGSPELRWKVGSVLLATVFCGAAVAIFL